MGISSLTVNENNLAKLLGNIKERNPNMTNTGIYQLKCDDCDAIYTRIRQTGRYLQYRVKEHRLSILKNHKSTDFAEHFFNGKDVSLFYYVNKGKVMDYLEILSIKKSLENKENLTNSQVLFHSSSIG